MQLSKLGPGPLHDVQSFGLCLLATALVSMGLQHLGLQPGHLHSSAFGVGELLKHEADCLAVRLGLQGWLPHDPHVPHAALEVGPSAAGDGQHPVCLAWPTVKALPCVMPALACAQLSSNSACLH